MTWEEYVASDGQIATEQEWEAAGKPAPDSQEEKAWVGSQKQKDWKEVLNPQNLPATAQEAIPRELYYDPASGNWYGVGPANKAYTVDPALAKQKYAIYAAKFQPPQALSLTIPAQPAIPPPPSPYEGMAPEELPEWRPGFWKEEFARAQSGKPATPATTLPPMRLTTRPDGSTGYLLPGGQWFEMTPAPKVAKPAPGGTGTYTDKQGQVWTWNSETGDYIKTGYDRSKDQTIGMSDYEKQQLRLAEERLRQEQETETTRLAYERGRDLATLAAAKEQRLAELAARPINWLQYAAETKTPPVVQPWMMPLAQEQYGWKVGQPIPGVNFGTRAQTVGAEPQFFSEEERQRYATPPTMPAPAGQDWRFFAGDWRLRNKEGAMAGSETLPTTAQGMNFENMPELLRPSAQLWGRMGPTAQQQLYGYQQAQSGISPEESEFRRQSTLPPGGRAPRWVWSR